MAISFDHEDPRPMNPLRERRLISLARLAVICAVALLASCATVLPLAPTVSVPIEALNSDVRRDTIERTICVPGYAATVRPADRV